MDLSGREPKVAPIKVYQLHVDQEAALLDYTLLFASADQHVSDQRSDEPNPHATEEGKNRTHVQVFVRLIWIILFPYFIPSTIPSYSPLSSCTVLSVVVERPSQLDRKSTRLNSSHGYI